MNDQRFVVVRGVVYSIESQDGMMAALNALKIAGVDETPILVGDPGNRSTHRQCATLVSCSIKR